MATYQQSYLNSCGASCLLCGAYELGINQIPQNPRYILLQAGPTPLELTQACETQIYQVTSNNPNNINPDGWSYSMPSQIVICARMLGLTAWATAYRTWSVRGLKIGYNNELNALRALNALDEPGGSWWKSNRSFRNPIGDQRELRVLLERKHFGMHYVMIRPDGTVMEPGAGVDYGSIQAAKVAIDMHGTGLSVFIQR